MAAIANELDRILAANPAPPETGELGRDMVIATSSPGGFKIASNGVASPATIELSAIRFNLPGTVTWSASNGTTIAADGNAASLDAVDMIAESATIAATLTYNGVLYERTIVINKVRDGANGDSAEPPDLSAAALLDTLTNQITESQLYGALRTRIALVDAAPSVPGSVGARILTEENARKDSVAAEASARNVQFANFDTSIKSYVQTYAYSKSSSDDAMSSLATQLRSEFSSNNGASVSWVQEYAYSRAQTDSAIAEYTTDLSTTVDGHTTSLQTQGTSINGLKAQYTVKIDNNGYVTGYGLASEVVNGTPKSSFIVNADKFAVVAPGQTPKVMFSVGSVNGQNVVGFSGALIGATGTFSGALSAATGTFSGSLSAATGTFAGSLSAASGTLGSLQATGQIRGGSYTGWGSPPTGKGGFILDPIQGIALGNYGDGRYLLMYANGDIDAPGLKLINKQLTLTSPIIISPVYSNFTVDFGGNIEVTGNGTVINMGTRTASVSGATVSSVKWETVAGITIENSTTLTATFVSRVSSLPGFNEGSVRCTVVATDGRTAVTTRSITCNHF